MKRLVAAAFALSFFCVSTLTQADENKQPQDATFAPFTFGYLSVQSQYPLPFDGLTLDGMVTHQFTPEVGLTGVWWVMGSWAEVVVGPTWTPIPELSLSFLVGGAQNNGEFTSRFGLTVLSIYKFIEFLGIVEFDHQTFQGDDVGVWYDLQLLFVPVDWLAVGLKDRRTNGFGLEVQFRYAGVAPWIAWTPIGAEAATFTPKSLMFGALYNF